MAQQMTASDKIVYSAIVEFLKENGYSPSVRELCRIVGKKSTATIQTRIRSLESKGYISTVAGAKRTIQLMTNCQITNADRIRAMTDEDLAYWIMCPYDSPYCDGIEHNCIECTKEWLQQPAEGD